MARFCQAVHQVVQYGKTFEPGSEIDNGTAREKQWLVDNDAAVWAGVVVTAPADDGPAPFDDEDDDSLFEAEQVGEADGVEKVAIPAEPDGEGGYAGDALVGDDDQAPHLPQLDHDGDGEPGGSLPHDPPALTGMSKAQLIAQADAEGVILTEDMTKAQIVDAIEGYRAARADDGSAPVD